MDTTSKPRSRRTGLIALAAFAVVVLASCNAGWVNPYVGDGTAGTTTGTVPNAQAQFTAPTGVVAIPGGGFYVYDAANCAIYKEANGQTSLYAGTPGTCGNTGDGGQATAATLDNTALPHGTASSGHGPGHDLPTPMTIGPDGSLYFAELTLAGPYCNPSFCLPTYRSQVRRIAVDGTITAVGNGIDRDLYSFVSGITTTPSWTVLVAVSTASGPGWQLSSPDKPAAGTTEIASIGPDGSQATVTTTPDLVYGIAAISDTQVATLTTTSVDRVDLTTGVATSTGRSADLVDNSLAASPDGTIYVGTVSTNTIVRIAPDDSVTTIAGNGTADPATTAQTGDGLDLMLTPTGLAGTPNDGLLIASGHVVYRLADPAHAGALAQVGKPLDYLGG